MSIPTDENALKKKRKKENVLALAVVGIGGKNLQKEAFNSDSTYKSSVER